MAEQIELAVLFGAEPPRHGLRRRVFAIDAVDDAVELEGRERPVDRRPRRLNRITLAAKPVRDTQPTSNPGQPGGNHGPTLPANFPLDFSSTTNMPKPCSTQCPDRIAALRHPTKSLVTGLPSAVMNRAVPGSASMAVLGATSAPHHRRRIRRSVWITGPSGCARVTPGFRGAIIGSFHFHGQLSATLDQATRAARIIRARSDLRYGLASSSTPASSWPWWMIASLE